MINSASRLLAVCVLAAGLAAPAFAQQTPAPSTDATTVTTTTDVAAPATEAAPAAPDITAPAVATAEVDNPYGLSALWEQGDFVSKGTLIVMVFMSMGTWYILFTKLLEQAKVLSQARAARKDFWTAGSIAEGRDKLKENSVFRALADTGIRAADHHDGNLTDQIDLNSWIAMSLQRAVEDTQGRLGGGLSFLATVGSTAPFVGLLGTVWGIYHALVAIGLSGQASIDKVAGPVGEALIMTAIGLAVAIPAVFAYNWLVRRNKAAMDSLRSFSADLHAILLAGTRKGQAHATARSA